MIVVAGLVALKPGHQDAASPLIQAVVEPTRKEPGCISYDMYATPPHHCFVFEQWESDEALQAHLATPHVVSFLQAMVEHLEGPPALNRYVVSQKEPLF